MLGHPLGHKTEVTLTSYPIDDLIRDYLIVDNGSVVIRNVTSSDRSCYALYEKDDPSIDDTPVFDTGVVFGTGMFLFGSDETTTTTYDATPREDTGEEDQDSYDDGDGTTSRDSCRIRFEFKCIGEDQDDGYYHDYNDDGYYARRVDFGYVFASEEYRDGNRGHDGTSSRSSAAASSAALGNDVLTISLNGRNIGLIPVGDDDENDDVDGAMMTNGGGVGERVVVPIAIDNVNSNTNSRYFVDYALDGRIISSAGFTIELGPYQGGGGGR